MTSTSDSNSSSSSSEHADVITQPGLYQTRMGAILEVTVEDSQSEGKQWVVRADGSPTYYNSDGRRVSYTGPDDDPWQLMWYYGPPSIPIAIPATDPITVKPGWWEMRDGEQIQVFEWRPDPPSPKNPFKWCGLTPFGDGDVIFWTDGGYCNFDASAATQKISDNDLVKFLGVPDSVQIRTLNETLQMKHEAIQEMAHDLVQRQNTIEAQAGAIQRLQTSIEEKVLLISAARLADLQERYKDMVVDRDEWKEKATEQERLVSFKIDTIGVPDSVQIRTLNETLQMKHEAIQDLEHDLAQRQKTIETQGQVIQNLQIGVEAIAAKRLADMQKSYNDMVVDRDEWKEKAIQQERLVSFKIDTIGVLQSQLSQMSKRVQSPADNQVVRDGIASLRAEIDRLSAEKESAARLAVAREEENDKLRQNNTDLLAKLEEAQNYGTNVRQALDNCLYANSGLPDELSLIVAKLTNPDNHQQQQIIVSGLTILSQLVRKNMDYRGSAFTPPILMPNVSPIVAMCCRASDKIARLANLLSGTRKQVESETVLDTIGDLAGYATLLYCYCNTIQGTSELEAIIEDASATTTTTDTTTTDTTTTTNVTEERQV